MIYEINNLRTRFEEIYGNNTWNMGQNETSSGLGSTLGYTTSIRKSLVEIIKQKNIKNMIDTSCGEWNWQKQIKDELCDYTGIDIVEKVIDRNNTLYKNEKTKFIQHDMLSYIKTQTDTSVDLIMCRHTLEHLPTDYNLDFIKECSRVCKYLLITTKKFSYNKELADGESYRPVNLETEPYANFLKKYHNMDIYDGPDSYNDPETYIMLYKF